MRRLAALAVCLLAAPLAAERPPYKPEQIALVRHVPEAKLAPDGRRVAFVSDATGEPELWVVDSAGGWPQQLTSLREDVTSISWSPDGRWLLFAADHDGDERRDLYRVPADGGAVEQL